MRWRHGLWPEATRALPEPRRGRLEIEAGATVTRGMGTGAGAISPVTVATA